ncbi:MAG TPA: hypothetical protein PLU85_04595 [Bacteroidia bacterium]|nr:hypothetical protein [Bacteroidia bacterium]QQR96422.1 MAG: hypothetical protein IPJ93_07430 [Bacteroidota bacterium]MBP7713510.1 hypothetical protein [Bacteroidia bacterium]MBP8667352.1 hypothetical protein [Bacteroidia bacterium]HOZ83146.1 hypothetical protein [Bacteroidia bacterium]
MLIQNKKILIATLAVLFFIGISFHGYCITSEPEHSHQHHKAEIGVGQSAVYFTKDKTLNYGLHLHLIRNIKHSGFGVGIEYERIFDRHGHNMLGIVGSYSPAHQVELSITPGILFEDSEPGHADASIHIEAGYHFDIKNIHLGPIVECALDRHDVHFSLGVHVGIGLGKIRE